MASLQLLFGCRSLHELVKNGKNGLTFRNSEQLSSQILVCDYVWSDVCACAYVCVCVLWCDLHAKLWRYCIHMLGVVALFPKEC